MATKSTTKAQAKAPKPATKEEPRATGYDAILAQIRKATGRS
jgi:hypothetical protein